MTTAQPPAKFSLSSPSQLCRRPQRRSAWCRRAGILLRLAQHNGDSGQDGEEREEKARPPHWVQCGTPALMTDVSDFTSGYTQKHG